MPTLEDRLKEELKDIHFIRPDETFNRVCMVMREYAKDCVIASQLKIADNVDLIHCGVKIRKAITDESNIVLL